MWPKVAPKWLVELWYQEILHDPYYQRLYYAQFIGYRGIRKSKEKLKR